MRNVTLTNSCVLAVVLALSGCGGAEPSTPVAPSTVAPQAAVPSPPRPVSPGQDWLAGYTLTTASLSGFVFEMTPGGRVPIAGALVYCELCGRTTHTWATADANGLYLFPGDVATGGGVWLSPTRGTPIIANGPDFEQRVFLARTMTLPITAGDTQFDIELVRR